MASGKHADALYLTPAQVGKMAAIAREFEANVGVELEPVLEIPQVLEAYRVLSAISRSRKPGNASKYWQRVRKYIGKEPILNHAASNTWLSVSPPTVRWAVAAWLHEIAECPPDKEVHRYFNFFDPFYFNGPVLDAAALSGPGPLNWALTVPFNTHLYWETDPEQCKFARKQASKKITELHGLGLKSLANETPERDYQPFQGSADFHSPDKKKRLPALRAPMEELVKHCSVEAHGDISSARDFNMKPKEKYFKPYMGKAIQHVFTAFRASITALRVDAKLLCNELSDCTEVKGELYNLASEPAILDRVELSWQPEDMRVAVDHDGSEKVKGQQLRPGERLEVRWEIDAQGADPMPEFWVDVYGHYQKTPDSGWHRAKVEGGLSIVYGPKGAGRRVPKGAPVDLILAFDITGSMGDAIDNMRDEARALIDSLREKKGVDLRLGLVGFRDHDDDEAPAFDPQPLTSSVDRLIRWMNDWEAKGGGDTPEDQYAALMRAIRMEWDSERKGKKVTKLIVVITDAPAKRDPVTGRDFEGNNAAKVAAAAEKVDPAHIYPIIIGSDAQAIADGEEIAALTGGKMLSADSGEEVAEVLLEAVETGIEEHAEPAAPTGPGSHRLLTAALLVIGLATLGLGLIVALTRGRSKCPHCGSGVRANATFCTSCGGEVGPRRCPNPQCGQGVPVGQEFCTACGTRVA